MFNQIRTRIILRALPDDEQRCYHTASL